MYDWIFVLAIEENGSIKDSYVCVGEREANKQLLHFARRYGQQGYKVGTFKLCREAVVKQTNEKIPVVLKEMVKGDFIPIDEVMV